MFCVRCTAFIDQWSTHVAENRLLQDGSISWTPYSELLHPNLEALLSASATGCSICRNAWHTLNKYEQKDYDKRTSLELEVRPDGGKPLLRANFQQPDGVVLSRMLAMFFTQDVSAPISQILSQCDNLDRSSTGAESSFKVANFWLSRCLEGHSRCPKPKKFLPTRVIDVNAMQGTTDVKLVETKPLLAEDQNKHFVALSHCWGKDRFLITKLETLEKHKQRIGLEELPPSFQDAVMTVRNMGLQYLWIDSLCIIQDSAEDWQQESVQMCKIYSQALFTITSAHASGAFGGMFRERDGVRTMPFEIELKLPAVPVRLMYQPTGQRELNWDQNDLPIYTRAWCFQEMILSTRNLIFDPTGIRWECVTSAGTENDLERERARHTMALRDMMTSLKRPKSAIDFFESISPGQPTMQALVWQSIVKDYGARDITKYEDKLIAIAGVAQEAEIRTDNKYLAGLWQRHLFMNLAWYVSHIAQSDGNHRVGNLPYRELDAIAPSWSWASVNKRIEYDSYAQQEQFCEIVNATVVGTPHRLSGKLTILGDTRQFYVLLPSHSRVLGLHKLAEEHRYIDHYNLSSRLFIATRIMLASSDPPSVFSRSQLLPVEWYPEDVWDEAQPLTFLAFMRRPRVEGMPLDLRRQFVNTLALVPTGKAENEYNRVGLAVWHDCSWFGHQCAEDKDAKAGAWKKLGRSFARVKAPEFCDDGRHEHPVVHEPLPDERVYGKSARMVRKTVHIV